MDNYITKQGDTWDRIAYDALGSEYLLPLLLEVNKGHRQTVIFSGGIELNIPDIDTTTYTERPDWLGEVDEV
ncbi:phage tail protein [Gracilibacillus oryzae]|uniref:Phage tail protein n=1 Tax=Gracilibacillus oryzae TaxID=1672701 RepID=A0A7C8KMX8_9BACI|nr:tail protein X [Gracilibacillus oryzae]KAB8126903.1 phage tail protein [Gracilibacillus oryzae]